MTTCFRTLAATVLLALLTSAASAQTTTGTGGTSGTGGQNTTSNTTGGTGTGGTGTGAASTGSGLSGDSSFGGTVPGESTTASNAASTFIGSNATQGFVGGATSAANQQQGMNRQFQEIQNNQTQQGTSTQAGTPREIRTTMRIGFVFPTATQSQISGRLANANVASLARFTSSRPELAGISVELNSAGVAVLTGLASNTETRRLAANLMRIQPGVRKVENQIVVPVN